MTGWKYISRDEGICNYAINSIPVFDYSMRKICKNVQKIH